MGKAENAVVKVCRETVAAYGGVVVRVQAGVIPIGEGAARRFMRGATPGAADLIGTYAGRALAIECKAGKGKQSPLQAEWQRGWEQAGGVYVLARGAGEVIEALGAIRRGCNGN